MQLIEKRPRLLLRKVLEAPLENSATVWMGRQLVHTAPERAHKAKPFRDDMLDDLLNNLFAMG